jgi:HK97 family phage major capsid protein
VSMNRLLVRTLERRRSQAARFAAMSNGDIAERYLDDIERADRAVRLLTSHAADQGPYGPQSRHSFFSDLVFARRDPAAAGRIREYGSEARVERSSGTGSFAGLTVPQYLIDLAAPLARAGRPFVDLIGSRDLPDEGMAVLLPKITQAPAGASQSAENATVSTSDFAATPLNLGLATVAVRADVSFQLYQRSAVAGDALMASDMLAAWNTELDRQAINGSGSSGEATGLLNTSSVQAVSYADASPTAGELLAKITYAARLAADARKLPMTCVLMSPRRWYWICKEIAAGAGSPIVDVTTTPPATGSPFVGTIAGMGVLLDGNVPQTLNTNQDPVTVCRPSDLIVLEPPQGPRLIVSPETTATSLGVNVTVYGEAVFTAARYASGIGVVSGTGLADPGAW